VYLTSLMSTCLLLLFLWTFYFEKGFYVVCVKAISVYGFFYFVVSVRCVNKKDDTFQAAVHV
jgi:hypothetical protein